MMRASLVSAHFFFLAITIRVQGQSTIDALLSPSAPTIAPAPAEPDNVTSSTAILDDVLASVNNDSIAPIVPAGFGNRPFMHAVNNNYRKEELMGRTLRLVVPKIEPSYVSNYRY